MLATFAVTAGAGLTPARTARTLNVTDTAKLKLLKVTGKGALIETGTAHGGLPGTVRVEFDVEPTVSASFSIAAQAGTIMGHGTGKLHGTGRWASFGGQMTVTHGTGRYVHASGHGGFYGIIERKYPYEATVQTTGSLSY